MIKAVVFDVGKVLFEWDLRCLLEKLVTDADELEYALSHVVTVEWHFQADQGRALADMVAERTALFPKYKAVIEGYAARFPESIPGEVPGSHDLVRRLAARKVPLFAITNFGHEFWQAFRAEQSIFDLFQDIVVSGTEKLFKPHAEIFELAEQRFGYPASEMLFIDDNAENISAARALGWQVHLFQDAGALEADLRARGVVTII